MNELIGLLVLSAIGNVVLIWVCNEELNRNKKLIGDCFDFMGEIIKLKAKVKELEK